MTSIHSRALATSLCAAALLFGIACGGEQQATESETAAAPTAAVPPPAPAAPPSAAPPNAPPPPDIPSNLTVDEQDSEGNPVRFSGTDSEGNRFSASIGEDVAVPDSLGDLPRYPGAQPMAALSSAGEGAMATFQSSDDQQTVYQFYVDELSSNGWTIESEKSFGGQRSFEATQARRKLTVSITGTTGDSRISIIATDEG